MHGFFAYQRTSKPHRETICTSVEKIQKHCPLKSFLLSTIYDCISDNQLDHLLSGPVLPTFDGVNPFSILYLHRGPYLLIQNVNTCSSVLTLYQSQFICPSLYDCRYKCLNLMLLQDDGVVISRLWHFIGLLLVHLPSISFSSCFTICLLYFILTYKHGPHPEFLFYPPLDYFTICLSACNCYVPRTYTCNERQPPLSQTLDYNLSRIRRTEVSPIFLFIYYYSYLLLYYFNRQFIQDDA